MKFHLFFSKPSSHPSPWTVLPSHKYHKVLNIFFSEESFRPLLKVQHGIRVVFVFLDSGWLEAHHTQIYLVALARLLSVLSVGYLQPGCMHYCIQAWTRTQLHMPVGVCTCIHRHTPHSQWFIKHLLIKVPNLFYAVLWSPQNPFL